MSSPKAAQSYRVAVIRVEDSREIIGFNFESCTYDQALQLGSDLLFRAYETRQTFQHDPPSDNNIKP